MTRASDGCYVNVTCERAPEEVEWRVPREELAGALIGSGGCHVWQMAGAMLFVD
ncbi:hypothetical protein A2U01_0100544, partial [Trifolium medium]|nr:hypothetical protein [Trifolium medium]